MVTATREAVERAVAAGIRAAADVEHPIVEVPVAARATGIDLMEHLLEFDASYEDLRAEMHAIVGELKR